MMGKKGLKVSLINVILNVFLALLKFIAGIFGKSRAMLSDSLHSLADVFSTFIVIIGIKMSSKNSNEKYQYGHERLENVASILLAFTLLMTGIFIGYKGIVNLVQHNFLVPNKIALFAALLSIVIKESMYWYTIRVGKRVNSASSK